MIFLYVWVENTVGRGEMLASWRQFLFCFCMHVTQYLKDGHKITMHVTGNCYVGLFITCLYYFTRKAV